MKDADRGSVATVCSSVMFGQFATRFVRHGYAGRPRNVAGVYVASVSRCGKALTGHPAYFLKRL
jgi:hypothetical protein